MRESGQDDGEGVEALSMRRLARALNRDAMTLYRYADSKGALFDRVLEQLSVNPEAPDWRAEPRHAAHHSGRSPWHTPRVLALLITRPLATPLGLRPAGNAAAAGTLHRAAPARALSPARTRIPFPARAGRRTERVRRRRPSSRTPSISS